MQIGFLLKLKLKKRRGHTPHFDNHHVVVQGQYLQPAVADEDVHLEAGEEVEAEVQADEAREVLQHAAPDQEIKCSVQSLDQTSFT